MKRGMKNKRGVFFSTDAMVAMLIILFVLIIAFPLRGGNRYETEVHQDILNSLSILKVGESSDSYVLSLIASGDITDLDKSLLEQIGEFYVIDPDDARALASAVLGDLNLSGNVGIWYGSTLIFSSNSTPIEDAIDIDVSRQILSGIESGGNVTGFSARAFLSSDSVSNYYYFGGYVGDGDVSFLAPYTGNINDARIELVVNSDFDLYVNDVLIGNYGGSSDDFTPVNYSLPIDEFISGDNLVEIKGTNLHIAGGFLKITYKAEVEFSQAERYRFPGIDGLINLYDGFYVPGDLTTLDIFLHMNSSVKNVFLNIGNVSVFNRTTDDEELITILNSDLSSLLDYDELSETTMPLRLGLENLSFLTVGQDVDVFSVTDISGGMSACALNCSGGGGSPIKTIDLVRDGNKIFVDVILNGSNNSVGLVGYQSEAAEEDYHPLSNDDASLKNKIDEWIAGGSVCVCCGINKAAVSLVNESEGDKFLAMVVMSAGKANAKCDEQDTGSAVSDAIQAACDAHEDYGIDVYSIGFGDSVDEATMQSIASCGNGSYYYSDVDQIGNIYEQVAEEIIAKYNEQTLEFEAGLKTKLFSDSYIEFGYDKQDIPSGLILTLEEQFSNSYGGSFSVPSDVSVIETRVTSYSGPRWTDNAKINDNDVYKLSNYGSDYIVLGDPYIVNIPNSYVSPESSNAVNLTTGVDPANSSGGSVFNKVLLTLVKNATAFSDIKVSADGCFWTIEFDSGGIIESNIPDSYGGGDQCFYTSGNFGDLADENDAMQVAVLNLLTGLDVDLDGKIDFLFDEEDLQISLDQVTGIPFTWSSEVQARRWY
jgi:hypothetical protein